MLTGQIVLIGQCSVYAPVNSGFYVIIIIYKKSNGYAFTLYSHLTIATGYKGLPILFTGQCTSHSYTLQGIAKLVH